MFQLDDKFLKDVGLDGLPDEQKKPFLQHLYNELELRVGTRLSDGLSDAQLEEFEAIIDRKDDSVKQWLRANVANYLQDPLFMRLKLPSNLSDDNIGLLSEYAATKWLEINRSDYKDIVGMVLDDLKKEVMQNRDAILGKD